MSKTYVIVLATLINNADINSVRAEVTSAISGTYIKVQ